MAQLEGMLTTLFHDPPSKGLVGRIRLWNVAVAVLVPILHQLLVAILPSHGWLGDAPLKANHFELVNSILRQARLGFLASRRAALQLEVRLVLVFALHFYPLAQIRALGDVAVPVNGLVFFEFFKSTFPASVLQKNRKIIS